MRIAMIVLLIVGIVIPKSSRAIDAASKAGVAEAAAQVKALEKDLNTLELRLKELRRQRDAMIAEAVEPAGPPPPTNNVPGYSDVKAPTYINDIKCRPPLKYQKTRPVDADAMKYCRPLSPWTRLLLENLSVGAGYAYTNIAGVQNVSANLPVVSQNTNSYQVGGGFSGKPILRHVLALFDDDPSRPREVRAQGSALEDLLINAVQLNAGGGYGRAQLVKNGTAVTSATSRPSFSVGINYVVDLERLYIHLVHNDWSDSSHDTRPVDAGYYYSPEAGFWEGNGSDPSQHGWIDHAPPPAPN